MHNPFRDLTKFERCLWLTSVIVVTLSYVLSGAGDILTAISSLVGVTALIFVSKGYVFGQFLCLIFAVFYGIVSFFFGYYGEMITYLGMSAPAALAAVISWMRHPYKGTKEVEVSSVTKKQWFIGAFLTIGATIAFYFILDALGTKNLWFSTLSVTTSIAASYLTFLRSPYYAIGYSLNDIVLIVLWVLASIENVSYVPMIVCFIMFLFNDLYGFYNWKKIKKKQAKNKLGGIIMDTKKINSGNVKMVAHRGVSGLERENTVPAFLAAGQRSYFGVETDVRVTKDGKFVLHHDSTPERVSNGKYKKVIEESTLAELQAIVLPDKDGSEIRQDIRIPSLTEYVHVCKKYDKKCVLEIKTPFTEAQLTQMVDEIKAQDYLDGMIFISFCADNCKMLRKLTDNKIQFLAGELSDAILEMCKEYRFDIDDAWNQMSKEWVDRFHAEGLEVNVWTVDDPQTAEKLVEMGVDYITTNILE